MEKTWEFKVTSCGRAGEDNYTVIIEKTAEQLNKQEEDLLAGQFVRDFLQLPEKVQDKILVGIIFHR